MNYLISVNYDVTFWVLTFVLLMFLTYLLPIKTANGILRPQYTYFTKPTYTSKCHMILWYAHKCDFIYAHKT
jgi:hypothetical protein